MALHRLWARNVGPEQILEAYYNVALLDVAHFTADYQFINHPDYNRDRSPYRFSACGCTCSSDRPYPVTVMQSIRG